MSSPHLRVAFIATVPIMRAGAIRGTIPTTAAGAIRLICHDLANAAFVVSLSFLFVPTFADVAECEQLSGTLLTRKPKCEDQRKEHSSDLPTNIGRSNASKLIGRGTKNSSSGDSLYHIPLRGSLFIAFIGTIFGISRLMTPFGIGRSACLQACRAETAQVSVRFSSS
jgi:hypothetical protein